MLGRNPLPSPFRNGSFLDRLAGGCSQSRSVPFPDSGYFIGRGRPALFKPKESLQAYGDNLWLYSAVNILSDEAARTPFRLQKRMAECLVRRVRKSVCPERALARSVTCARQRLRHGGPWSGPRWSAFRSGGWPPAGNVISGPAAQGWR
jgi:hypothetical protein